MSMEGFRPGFLFGDDIPQAKHVVNDLFGVPPMFCHFSPSGYDAEALRSVMDKRYGLKFEPERIIKSGNATIVFWKDGTKTVVKCAADEEPNEYNAFTAALAIKLFGTNSHVKKIIKNKTVIQEKKGKVK